MRRAEDRHFILQIALKCADISNPCRPWDISSKWSYKVCEEFFRQGDYERRLNLPVTSLCDRHTTSIPKIQAGFFKHVVTPLYVEWHRFLSDGLSVSLMKYLKANQKRWEIQISQEATTDTEISELDKNEVTSSGEEISIDEDSGSIDLLIPTAYGQTARVQTLPSQIGLDRVGRRHSIPLGVSKALTLSPCQTIRRESLPIEKAKTKDILLKLEKQSLLEFNITSLLSSKNSIVELSNTSAFEKPVSTEDLLPETSIASITSSANTSRLNALLQSNKSSAQTKQLKRQQTFPPLQSYARMRYMSATAEMTQCYTHILEANSSSNCSTSMKDKSCSSGQCSLSLSPLQPHDAASYHQKKSNILKISKELLTVDRKQNSSLDMIKLKRIVSSERRHSMNHTRTIHIDDCSSTNQNKRPYSAQDSTSTQIFYALLTDLHNDKGNHISDTSEHKDSDCNVEYKYCDTKSMLQESRTTLSHKKLDQLTLARNVYSPQESRRYSIPIAKHNTITINNANRRYTAIPVSSELDIHKVFFIGSPPDSPSRNYSISSSNDIYSESKKSIDDSGNEIIVIGNKRELDYTKGKSSKIIKLSSDMQMKENIDPRKNDDFNKGITSLRRDSQVI
jgi:hypothetical protein